MSFLLLVQGVDWTILLLLSKTSNELVLAITQRLFYSNLESIDYLQSRKHRCQEQLPLCENISRNHINYTYVNLQSSLGPTFELNRKYRTSYDHRHSNDDSRNDEGMNDIDTLRQIRT